jgi:gamma-glutamylcyclotransferase (GGCT)/AIG2-like uncharacterized protein YtfP
MTETPDAGVALFTYGSLMFDEVWRPLVPEARASMRAELAGFRREAVSGEAYPGIVADPAATTEGRVYMGLEPSDLTRLDRFEGTDYARITVQLGIRGPGQAIVRVEAQAYVFRSPERLSGEPWDPGVFAKQSAQGFYTQHSGGPPSGGQ